MYNIDKKYSYYNGTHCWYCKRQYDDTIIRTKDHILPKALGGRNHVGNYIGCCLDCNALKANKDLLTFADRAANMGKLHKLYKYRDIINFQAWKLYNKTDKAITRLHMPRLYKF